ncbi:MAG: LysE family transporter [Flavobacteriales bacterium]|nr:LysE family transporter [Flavobacteriales bacterium]
MSFIQGFIVGLGMVIFIGPVFFTLLKGTLNYGRLAGWAVAFGIFISDVVCVGICYAGAAPFFKNPNNQFWIAIVGAVILLAMGINYLISSKPKMGKELKVKSKEFLSFFIKGYLVNFVNPFVFLVWISVIAFAEEDYGNSTDLLLFLSAALLAILFTDTLKVFFAHKLKKFIKENFLLKVYKVIGIIMLIFGLRLVWFAIQSMN